MFSDVSLLLIRPHMCEWQKGMTPCLPFQVLGLWRFRMTEEKVMAFIEQPRSDETEEHCRLLALSLIVKVSEEDAIQRLIAFACAYASHNFESTDAMDRFSIGAAAYACLLDWHHRQVTQSPAIEAMLSVWQNGGQSSLMKGRPMVFWHEGTGQDRRNLFDEKFPELFRKQVFRDLLEAQLVEASVIILYFLYWGVVKKFR